MEKVGAPLGWIFAFMRSHEMMPILAAGLSHDLDQQLVPSYPIMAKGWRVDFQMPGLMGCLVENDSR